MWMDGKIEELPAGKKVYDGQMVKRLLPLLKPFRIRILGGERYW